MPFDDYTLSHLDLSISEFVDGLVEIPQAMRLAWVTCVDSNLDVVSVAKHHRLLSANPAGWQAFGAGVILKTVDLQDINRRDRLFFGFDEVWFLAKRPGRAPARLPHIVPPLAPDARLLNRVATAMANLHCSLIVGDGEGLNFVTKIRGPARTLFEAASAV